MLRDVAACWSLLVDRALGEANGVPRTSLKEVAAETAIVFVVEKMRIRSTVADMVGGTAGAIADACFRKM